MSTDDWLGWPDGVGRVILGEVDSTMAEAGRLASTLNGPAWILAERQTKGRGRRGRDWIDPTGNFAATLVLHPGEPTANVALRSFVASLALYDALVACSGRSAGFSLKWPNDVLLNGGKLAGILLESNGTGNETRHLSVGIGVNLSVAPAAKQVEGAAVRPVSLAEETGTLVTPAEFLSFLAPAYDKWERQFTTYGFAPIREAWLQRAARLGDVITARTGSSETTGTFETIDETGQLILSTAKGRQAIPAADIFF